MGTEDANTPILRKIQENLDEIKVYQRIGARSAVEAILKNVASSPERQQMWRLADGTLSNDMIADRVGVTLRTVQYFVEDADKNDLLTMAKRGYPKRVVDIIPADWKPWKPKKAAVQPQPPLEPADEKTEAT
jgi:hypothetical protein